MTTPTQGEHAKPEALRLAKYVARRKLAKQLHTDEIHGFDSGCDTEAVLRLSDIEAVLAQATAQPAAPQGGERAVPETLGVYCGIASDDVTDPTHPRYVAGFKAGHAAGKKRASHGQAPAGASMEALRHSANEWADMAANGLQWVRNIADGISDPKVALENLEANLKHCREVNDSPEVQAAVRAAAAPTAQPAPAAQQPASSNAAAVQQSGATKEHLRLVRVIADKIEDGTLFQSGIYSNKDLARFVRNVADAAAPQPSPTPQADSQPAPADVEDAIAWLVTWKGGEHTYAHAHASELPAINQARIMGGTVTPCVAARAPADSVTAPAAGAVAGPTRQQVSDRFGFLEGLVSEHTYTRIVDEVAAMLAAAPTPAAQADSVLEDAARLWDAFVEAWRNELGVDKIVNIMGGADKLKAVFLDAARKQGGA